MRGRWFWGVVGLGVVALGAAGWLWRSGQLPLPVQPAQAKAAQGAASAASAASAPVTLEFQPQEVVQPQRLALARVIEFSGPLVAPDTAVVRAKAAGTLVELKVAEGDLVRARQPLARVDVADLAGRLAEREAALAAALAARQQAEQTHASNERLAAQQFISQQALANSRSALDNAAALADQARAALAALRAGARETALVAPINGVVAKRHVVAGEKVAPEQPVLTIVDLARLELAGAVGTHEVAALRAGLPVQVRVEGLAQPIAGTLARIAPAAEAGTRSIGVAVVVPNPGQALRAGSYAMAQVVLPGAQPQLTLPLAAVSGSSGAQQVWLLEGGKLLRRGVTLGRADEAAGRVEVLAGVNEASRVLAQRFDNLRDGAPAVVK